MTTIQKILLTLLMLGILMFIVGVGTLFYVFITAFQFAVMELPRTAEGPELIKQVSFIFTPILIVIGWVLKGLKDVVGILFIALGLIKNNTVPPFKGESMFSRFLEKLMGKKDS